MKGFGSVAIGTRLSHIKDDFFISWSNMIVSGIRRNDGLLAPQKKHAAHKAANNLVREFLNHPRRDSLLFVDDDMTFPRNALEKLRVNPNNWQFDIVSGVANTKTDPPRPIVMRLLEEQPEHPENLEGEMYGFYDDYKEGETVAVATTGIAFTLVRRKVFEKMVESNETKALFTYFFEYKQGLETEDISFMRKARKLGFKIGVDTSVKIGHIGDAIF
jgi:hypothetical protein